MKSKAPIIALAIVAILVAAYFIVGRSAGGNAYESFTVAMDKIAGQGKWSAKGHSVSALNKTLTVEDLKVEAKGGSVTFKSVALKSGLKKEKVEALLATKEWRNQPATDIAGALVLNNVSIINAKGVTGVTIDKVDLQAVKLAAADANAPAGPVGFLKALSFDGLNIQNVKTAGDLQKELGSNISLGSLSGNQVSFTGPSLPNLDQIDPSGLLSVLSSFKAKETSVKNVDVTFAPPSGVSKDSFTLKLAESVNKDIESFGKMASSSAKGLEFSIVASGGIDFKFKLDDASSKNIDYTEYYAKMAPLFVTLATNPDNVDDMVNNIQTLGDLLVSPFSFDDILATGMHLSVTDAMTPGMVVSIDMEEFKLIGPYKAGEIPAKQTNAVKNLVITLPEEAASLKAEKKELADFVKFFGMNKFVINADGEADYNAKSGVLTSKINKFEVKDLMSFNVSQEMGGLTPDRLDVLKKTPLNSMLMVMMAPDQILGDMSFNRLDWKLTDQSLMTRVYSYVGKGLMDGASEEDVKQTMVAGLNASLTEASKEFLGNHTEIEAVLNAFIKKPGSLELNIKPELPINLKNVQAGMNDKNKYLNSLNVTLTSNGEKPVTVKFNLPEINMGNVDPEFGMEMEAE